MRRASVRAVAVVAAGLCGTLAAAAFAEPKARQVDGWSIELGITVKGTPVEVYDAMTGDVLGWWDHGFAEKPKRRYIDARPGGGFMEIFDDSGDGVQHATVIYAHRGKLLRFSGPLGFSGHATEMVTTWAYAASGDSTRVTVTCNVAGQSEPGWSNAVEQTWKHFIVDRFKPWYERGGHRARTAAPKR
jgi:uncharacterized protein YndB with AHSA1/START domain